MIKYVERFAECDDCVCDIFKYDTEKDVFLECMTNDKYSYSYEEKEEIIAGEYGTPSEWIEFYPSCDYDTLEDAIKGRDESNREWEECMADSQRDID